MPKPQADSHDAEAVRAYLAARGALHLRARKYGALGILESGPVEDPISHPRLPRDTVHPGTLEIATHMGRWEKAGFRGLRNDLLDLLMTTLPWTIAPIE